MLSFKNTGGKGFCTSGCQHDTNIECQSLMIILVDVLYQKEAKQCWNATTIDFTWSLCRFLCLHSNLMRLYSAPLHRSSLTDKYGKCSTSNILNLHLTNSSPFRGETLLQVQQVWWKCYRTKKRYLGHQSFITTSAYYFCNDQKVTRRVSQSTLILSLIFTSYPEVNFTC